MYLFCFLLKDLHVLFVFGLRESFKIVNTIMKTLVNPKYSEFTLALLFVRELRERSLPSCGTNMGSFSISYLNHENYNEFVRLYENN